MIYQALLYSRSLSKDYRWMIVPQKVSEESLKVLKQLYNMFDKRKDGFHNAPVSPLYCLNHPEMTFLVSCGLSNHKDKDGRAIYCLQGIGVMQKYKRHLWLMIPWILTHYDSEGILNTWSKIDFSDADNIVSRKSEDYYFKSDQLEESLVKLHQTRESPPVFAPTNNPACVTFDGEGLKELAHLISLSRHDRMDFAFGATPEMIDAFDFRIIASVGNHPIIRQNKEIVTANVTPFRVTEKRNDALSEHHDNLADRFNPITKKSDVSQKKASGGHGHSHKIRQLLPRFLSLFKIGKKPSPPGKLKR
ncbi:MAG: hypothetical protein U0586_01210 [Candidatus Brocadiaceae bacterium]